MTIEHQLRDRLEHVAHRARQLRFSRVLAIGWTIVAMLGLIVALSPGFEGWHRVVALPVFCVIAGMTWIIARRAADQHLHDPLVVARRVERAHPDLNARLLTAVELVESKAIAAGVQEPTPLGYLESLVVQQVVNHADAHDWTTAVPRAQVSRWRIAHLASIGLMAAMLAGLVISAEPFAAKPNYTGTPGTPLQLAAATQNTMTVEPGDASIERGTSLIITARFSQSIPAGVTLVIDPDSAAKPIAMTASLSDPIVGARVPSVTKDFTYRIVPRVAAASSDTGSLPPSSTYKVTVFDYPDLQRADATLRYPDYTGLSEKVIEDTRQISAVEGTRATWSLQLNKPVKEATLSSEDGGEVKLLADAATPSIVTGAILLDKTRRWKLTLIDEAGRRNRSQVDLLATALPNRPAKLELVFPRRDLRVSPLEEALLAASATDDFGVKSFGLTFSLAEQTPTDVVLATNIAGTIKHTAEHVLSFEAMKSQPGQLLSYFFWAEDVGPDGKGRRVFSDMYFAEVRHFEEIFRHGEQPDSEQQQKQQQNSPQMQQINEALKDQRAIIIATWNLIRREDQPTLSEKFAGDAEAIRDSQAAALEKVNKLKGTIADAQQAKHVDRVIEHMSKAVELLTAAAEKHALQPLKDAVPAEQAAYQALLKLQAREHEVIRQRQQRGQQGQQQQAQSPSQQQLDQLELKNEENRYESQRLAQDQQEDPAKRETRQALNRLRELARRQSDLNEKLKELELALQEAKTEKERQELERQLKRLREQQQEMLRDVDELKNRMEKPENQQAMQDARQQVEQARQNVRQASEALEKGMTDKALAEGARAQRQLEQLREDFRRKAAGQFSEEMKQMRQDARQLAQKQEEAGKKLADLDQQKGAKSLRDEGPRKEITDELEKQKGRLSDLKEKIKNVSEQAEANEPVLSKQLYDTLRQADQKRVEQSLEVARLLVDKGLNEDAKQVEPQARAGINEIRKGVEKAAESVIGDEAQALQRAREMVEDLARRVQDEADAKDPSGARQEQLADAGKSRSGEPREGDSKQGKQNAGQRSGEKQGAEKSESQKGNQPGESPKGHSQNGDEKKGGEQPNDQAGEQPGEQAGKQPGDQKQASGQQPGEKGDKRPGRGEKGNEKGGEKGQPSGEKGQPSNEKGQPNAQANVANPSQSGEQSKGDKGKGESQGKGDPNQKGQPLQSQASGNGQSPSQSADAKQSDSPDSKQASSSQQPSQSASPSKGPRFLQDQARSASNRGSGPHGPITGEDFRDWSDALRDVEEMIEDPKLREEVARIREKAKELRAEFKRHSKEPQWDLVRKLVAQPLNELSQKLGDELARKDPNQPLTPIDRDPVPGRFGDLVKRYYEKIGGGD